MNERSKADYHSYLLRLWQPRANAPWQASLQSTFDARVYRFSDMAELVGYLLATTRQSNNGSDNALQENHT